MKTHDCYAAECYEKQTAEIYFYDELVPKDDREKLMVECAYRRGYSQGFFYCIRLPAYAARMFYDLVFDWRIEKHGGVLRDPPCFFKWLENFR